MLQPVNGGADADSFKEQPDIKLRTAVTMACGLLIGWVCGFTGGGGVMLLTAFTLILGYNLKVAVGTSTMIMTAVALIGAISHFSIGADFHALPTFIIVFFCAIGALIAAVYANRCNTKKLNYVIGIILLILGGSTIITKFLL
ncbi:MAG: sulfite exporter TauE/SafE family protein [Lachnospiraceae bacterium]|nr:sulfite exporter TauE/SafE family protein [Lachnospiraceae bacterium]